MLPVVLKKAVVPAVILLAAIGMIAFYASEKTVSDGREPKVRIGYAADDDMITRLAVSYVESMESVKSLCSLEKTTLDDGKRKLEEGGLSALIVLPENVVGEILSGSNTPAVLYLPPNTGEGVTGSRIFEELANAAVGMLQTAQAQIYAAADLSDGSYSSEQIQSVYDDINRFNLSQVGNREELFKRKLLSATENNSYAVYYAGAFMALCMLMAGVLFGDFCKRSRLQQRMIKRRAGVPYAVQLLSRVMAMIPLLLIILILPLLLPALPAVNKFLSYAFSDENAAQLLAVIFACLLFTAVYVQLIYQLVKEAHGALVQFGMSAVFKGYMSGCFIPSALLPEAIANVGKYLPASYMRMGFTMLFTGNMERFPEIIAGLLLWSILCFAITWAAMFWLGNEEDTETLRKMTHMSFKTPFFIILFKRLIYQKSLWVCLSATVIISAAVASAERNSRTYIPAAVYDEKGVFEDGLAAHEGLVDFVICENEDEVKRLVLSGDAECGYVLPQELSEDQITVYEDGDAVASRVVDEVLYSILFEKTAYSWFTDYITGHAGFENQTEEDIYNALKAHTTGKTTFSLDIRHVGAVESSIDKDNKANVTFPVWYAVSAGVLLCAGQGIMQTLTDIRKKRFYKRNRIITSAITILQPVMLGIAAGIITLLAVIDRML